VLAREAGLQTVVITPALKKAIAVLTAHPDGARQRAVPLAGIHTGV